MRRCRMSRSKPFSPTEAALLPDPRKIWLASWRPGDSMSLKLKAPPAILDAIQPIKNHCGRVLVPRRIEDDRLKGSKKIARTPGRQSERRILGKDHAAGGTPLL